MDRARLKPGQRLELSIEKLSIGGRGVARANGVVVFVPGAAPGDRLLAQISSSKKNFAEAEIVSLIEGGPHRIDPPCSYARSGACGGCSWQHVEYSEQLRQKRLLVEESLHKLSGFEGFEVLPPIPSPLVFRYRNRIQVHRGPNDELGFMGRRSSRVVDIEDCLVAEEPLATALHEARAALRDRSIDPPPRFELKVGRDGLVRAEGASFAQVNSRQNENLVRYVVGRFAALAGGGFDAITDLYSGDGNFTFPLARAFPHARVDAVELDPEAVERGNALSLAEGLAERVRFRAQPVEQWTANLAPAANGRSRTAALLDPPRVGCGPGAAEAIASAPFSLVIYVSCHPATLARDLRAFRMKGWALLSAQPFDMFPQTDHVEVVACLAREGFGETFASS